MSKTTEYYQQLLKDYINNTCTPEQVEEVLLFLQQDASNRLLLQHLQAEFDKGSQEPVPAHISDNLRNRLLQAIQPAPVIPMYRRTLFRVALAAVLVIAVGSTWFFFPKTAPVKEVVRQQPPANRVATITLPNGEVIPLDGTITQQNVIKLSDGQVSYDTTNTEVSYHTLTVPAGCKMVQLMLADGTTVWLNNTSTLKYPTAFTGPGRKVELTGEAYFEVKHDATKPFEVLTKDMTVHVLGTSFNISAYNDDANSQVALVQGSVALLAGSNQKQLVPGELATFETGKLSISSVNTDEYTSWRKGYLIFKQASLEQIVKQLSRYYGEHITIDIQALNHETFSGRLDLQNNIEQIMQIVCTGTSMIYLPAEKKLTLKK
jgi:transmembrane sensor